MTLSFYLKGSKQVLLLGDEARVCLFGELPVAAAAGVQEIISRRLQEAPASPEQPRSPPSTSTGPNTTRRVGFHYLGS